MGGRSIVCVLGVSWLTLRIQYMNIILLKCRNRGYVTDENVEQACRTYAKIIRQINGAFSFLRQVYPTCERREAGDFVAASMKTWHKLGLNVTPKARIFEDHAIEYMQTLSGLGDKTEDFIELYHKDGARQDRYT